MQGTKRVKREVQDDAPASPSRLAANRALLARAAEKAGDYAKLARLLNRTKSAVQFWKESGRVPDHTLRLLELWVEHGIPLSGDPGGEAAGTSDVAQQELYIRRSLSKVLGQLIRLAWQTRATGEKWETTERLLDAFMPKSPGTFPVVDVNPLVQVAEVLDQIRPSDIVTALFARLATQYRTEAERRAFHRRTEPVRRNLLKLVEQYDRETLLVTDVVGQPGGLAPAPRKRRRKEVPP